MTTQTTAIEAALQEAIDTISYLKPDRYDDATHEANFKARLDRLRAAQITAGELFEALDVQTEAAQHVVDCWTEGDLAGAVRSLDCCVDPSRDALAKATEE